MDSYELSIFENIERTHKKLKALIEYLDPKDWNGFSKTSAFDLVNHLDTQLQEMRHASEVVIIDSINKEISSW